MAQDYFGPHMNAMDRGYYAQLDSFGAVYHPAALHSNPGDAKTSLGPRELGTTANPMQNQLQALQSKIREGASSIEFQFAGQRKGSAQASTPESYGWDEREAMRSLAEYNDVKTSTHATFTVSGLAGFDKRNGFNKEQQHMVMEEVRRAVDFASQATTGGAIVVHTGEWDRPVSEQDWATKDFAKHFKPDNGPNITSYAAEPEKAILYAVDSRTGEIVTGIRKDLDIFEPKWVRASEYEANQKKKLPGINFKGERVEIKGNEFVDVDGKVLDPDDADQLFHRLPHWDEKNTRFETERLTWNDIKKRSEEYNQAHPEKHISPEEMYARIQLNNQILQARGNSLYHGQRYDDYKETYKKLQDALEFADEIYGKMPPEQQWKALRQQGQLKGYEDLIPAESKDVRKALQEQIADMEKQMRHIHEASSAADVQARTLEERRNRIESMEGYGLKQTGQALGQLGMYAMEKSKQMRDNVRQKGGDVGKYEDLYIAPENVFTNEYGSHPDELIKIVEAGREQMAKELMEKRKLSADKAKEMAAKHIKSTFDIGHLNMWKTHMQRKQGESDAAFNKRFENWTMDKLEVMHKRGILGHFHLTDNMGFNDEHLTPGQGNAPIRSFVKKLEELGYKEFIVEPGSFNYPQIIGETWSYLGVQGFNPFHGQFPKGGRFTDVHWQHAASYAPPNYIFGAYAPSNEWTLWSGVPFE